MHSTSEADDAVFAAIAEPRRREMMQWLASGAPRTVGEVVDHFALPQPAVSKHLAVLRNAGLVDVEKRGQQRLYRIKLERLKHVREWIDNFDQLWTEQLNAIKQTAERKARVRAAKPPNSDN
jgi:DNA-binding transcriptional ArsR family regulator